METGNTMALEFAMFPRAAPLPASAVIYCRSSAEIHTLAGLNSLSRVRGSSLYTVTYVNALDPK